LSATRGGAGTATFSVVSTVSTFTRACRFTRVSATAAEVSPSVLQISGTQLYFGSTDLRDVVTHTKPRGQSAPPGLQVIGEFVATANLHRR
jgi:hypothetical protein